jgi:Holliday junction DNA helicase RuvA
VYCAEATLHHLRNKMLENNAPVKLITRLLHREEVFDLYGFLSRDEYTLFNMLLKVSGVGPRQALNILGMGETAQIVRAIVAGDDTFLMQLRGIGKKRAQQIIFELKESLGGLFDVSSVEGASDYGTAVSALESLGFSVTEARQAVEQVTSSYEEALELSEVIEKALKQLSKG